MAKIGRYELIAQLASGNTGYVYSARPTNGSTVAPIALKLIKPRLSKDQRYSQLLLTEAQHATGFEHPNAVHILEIAQSDDDLFIAMELVEGRPLSAVLQRSIADRRPLSPELIFWISCSVASVLHAAHATPWAPDEVRGMYHGEVSPQSILITWDGRVKVVGVGIGRSRICLPPARARLPYRAPELFARSTLDPTNDVYGLGVILYEGLTRRNPFQREQVSDTRQAILDNVYSPLAIERPDLVPAVDELVGRMMSREPSERPEDIAFVEHVLRSLLLKDDDVLSRLLAEEMRILFVEELSEAVLSANQGPEEDLSGPWDSVTSPLAKALLLPQGTRTPPPQVLSESNPVVEVEPPREKAHGHTGIYDEFDVDSLVDAIVAASSSARHTPLPAVPPAAIPTRPEPSPASPPARRAPPPPPLASPFAKALDEKASEFEIDELVDAIVHASAKAREPLPRTPSSGRPKKDQLVVKEAIHAGAIVDVAVEPRKKSGAPAVPPAPQPASDVDSLGFKIPDDIALSDAMLLKTGDIVGNRYRVVDRLGVGGMSVVYKVEHFHLQKLLALKLLRPELSTIPFVVQRFQREARCVSQLDDPHIVRVTDFGRADNGSLYLVMELIEGESLTHRLETKAPLKLHEALSILEQLLAGLEHAHRNNVIHRDLKPDNIMLVSRDSTTLVKIVDFGIAKLVGDEALDQKPLTQAGMVFGSPRYMSPEQANGETVDARADLYAAAIIAYEMLTGRRPFDGKSANAVFSKLLTQPAPPMNLTDPNVIIGQRMEQVILRALSKSIDERYPTAGALWEALLQASRS